MTELLEFDMHETVKKITKCIMDTLTNSNANGYVIGISGGIDSAVTAALLVRAVGSEKVTGLIMPEKETRNEDIEDALTVVNSLGIKYMTIDITKVVEELLLLFGDSYAEAPRIPKGNAKARVRMLALYYFANKHNYLVAATGDKSEFLLGYFTKWGDGAGDIYPIINLYKSQVRRLGAYLKLPEKIVTKPSSPGLWPGQTAEGELGLSYDTIDQVLTLLIDRNYSVDKIVEEFGVDRRVVEDIVRRIRESEHKRNPFKFCRI